jgi:hypothetical protein
MADNEFKDIREYAGEQIILASNRLVFNARLDSILLSSRQYINLSAGDKVTIDVGVIDTDNEQNMFLVNAPRIQFGLGITAKTIEPVVKGDKLEEVLNDIIQALIEYSTNVSTSVPPWSPLLKIAELKLTGDLNRIKNNKIKPAGSIKSDVTYTI